eukprot:5617230-Pyramimonas_sp.AAC.1
MRFVREGDRNAELFYLFSQELQDQARRGEATEGTVPDAAWDLQGETGREATRKKFPKGKQEDRAVE